MTWFSVRCVFRLADTYEERITLWQASSFAEAVQLGEAEANEYAADIDGEYLGLAQAYALFDSPGHGAEVFSLLRGSTLAPQAYLDAFFDTGLERQGAVDAPEATGDAVP